jgi:hypothetical protein
MALAFCATEIVPCEMIAKMEVVVATVEDVPGNVVDGAVVEVDVVD